MDMCCFLSPIASILSACFPTGPQKRGIAVACIVTKHRPPGNDRSSNRRDPSVGGEVRVGEQFPNSVRLRGTASYSRSSCPVCPADIIAPKNRAQAEAAEGWIDNQTILRVMRFPLGSSRGKGYSYGNFARVTVGKSRVETARSLLPIVVALGWG